MFLNPVHCNFKVYSCCCDTNQVTFTFSVVMLICTRFKLEKTATDKDFIYILLLNVAEWMLKSYFFVEPRSYFSFLFGTSRLLKLKYTMSNFAADLITYLSTFLFCNAMSSTSMFWEWIGKYQAHRVVSTSNVRTSKWWSTIKRSRAFWDLLHNSATWMSILTGWQVSTFFKS